MYPLTLPLCCSDADPFSQEVFDNDHRVISQKGSSTGRFTFTAADAGDHKICFTPSHSTGQIGWFNGQALGGVKLTLDLAIGETSAIESEDKGKIQDIAQKVRDLNGRLQDIRREQVFQRVSMAFPTPPPPFHKNKIMWIGNFSFSSSWWLNIYGGC